jgi:hypothetical protein
MSSLLFNNFETKPLDGLRVKLAKWIGRRFHRRHGHDVVDWWVMGSPRSRIISIRCNTCDRYLFARWPVRTVYIL